LKGILVWKPLSHGDLPLGELWGEECQQGLKGAKGKQAFFYEVPGKDL